MTQPKRKRILGLPPVLFVIAVVFIVLFIVGFLAGPIGSEILDSLFGVRLSFPEWLVIDAPQAHLPAPVLFKIFGWPITNSILAAFLTVIVLVLGSYLVTRRLKTVPGRMQAAVEFLLGWLFDFCKSVAGEKNGRKFFPVIATIFLFVLFNSWLSLIPGFGAAVLAEDLGPIPAESRVQSNEENEELILVDAEGNPVTIEGETPHIVMRDGEYFILRESDLLRGANTDVNTPLAIAIISFVFVWFYGVRSFGLKFFKQYFNFGKFFRGIGQVFTGKLGQGFSTSFSGIVDIFVGLLELLSVFIRLVSFTFRLFGNMTAGEILLLITAFLVPLALALPFYGLELFFGLIQALIFSGLTLVFVTLAVTPHEAEHT